MSDKNHEELSEINDINRAAILEWLNDRSHFHTWFTSLIVGSFVILTVFGNKPGFNNISEVFLSASLILLLLSLLCNLVCVWSIPSWKYRVSTGSLNNARVLRRELAITARIGVICFVSGLTIGFVGNLPN